MPYLTPETIPEDDFCRPLSIPNNGEWLALVSGALTELAKPYNWEQFGAVTVEDTVARMQEMINNYYSAACAPATVPTPFWDEAQDLDDQPEIAVQPWYGEVDDANAPPDEITFIENVGIWVITGFVAYAATPAAAIFFHTIAPRFVHAFHKGDFREIFRVVVDSADYGYVDTDEFDEDEIIEMSIITDEEIEGHDIYIINMPIP